MSENKFSKTDMERIGVFQEMGYTTISDKYKSTISSSFNEAAAKGKQMLPGGSKARSSLQAGYFNDKYNRVMEGESYSDPIKLRRQNRLKESQKNIGKPFLPSSGDKKPSGLGNHYGTLSGAIGAFSPQDKQKKPYKSSGKNFYTNPGKHGTGFGYVNVTISAYHKYASDEYERGKDINKRENESHRKSLKGGAFRLNMAPKSCFDENPYRSDRALPGAKKAEPKKIDVKPFKPSSPGKQPGGLKAGTFDSYPSHSADPFNVKYLRPIHVVNKAGKIFMPSAGPKSAPVNSIVNLNVTKTITPMNYKTTSSVMAY